MSRKLIITATLATSVALLDQVTKAMVNRYVAQGDWVDVIPGFFRITHARNPGAALGLFQDIPIWVFIGLTCVALGLIVSFYRSIAETDRLQTIALGLILGGAVGNLIDRVQLHAVIDFLQFDLGLFIFPDFNVADSGIVIGTSLILLDFVSVESSPASSPPETSPSHQNQSP